MRRGSLFFGFAVSISLGAAGCEPGSSARIEGALGVYYGGQIQEREVVEVGARPPSIGFRLVFPEARSENAKVAWQIVRPGPEGRRVTEIGSFDVPSDRSSFDQPIELRADSPLGTWNVRVSVGDELIIDRALSFERPRLPDRPESPADRR